MIVLITGSSRGIGRYIAEKLIEAGHTVIGCSRSESDFANQNYEHHVVDVCDEADIRAMFASVRRKHKTIDGLINNAGIASMNHFLLTPTETARQVMDINYLGTFTMCREGARLMRKSKSPRIINFGTVAVPLNLAGEAAYAASKSAVTTLTKVLARELAQYQITVNAIGPTPIKTDLIAGVPEEKLAELLGQQAIHRFGTVEDVFNLVEFLLKPESNFITGQVIYLGGVS